ncbi:MAG: hypothetical protein EBV06_08625, partial [Planctomycetia bacterium]|nr:hypothetical protein [Planctomycetia bacterium]
MNVNEFRRIAPGLLTAERFASRVPLEYRQGLQTLPWERFQGRLVATRQMRTLESWSVFTDDRELLSLKLEDDRVHIVRGIESYTHQPHDTPEGIQTRESSCWQLELIASMPLTTPNLERELMLGLQRAVWGARLPLTPEESPHPLFSFGLLAYGVADTTPGRRVETWLRMLRPTPQALAAAWKGASGFVGEQGLSMPQLSLRNNNRGIDRPRSPTNPLAPLDPYSPNGCLLAAMRQVFDDVSLSPWTDFIPLLLDAAESLFPPGDVAEWLASLLLLVTRHLTAYDLHLFHHRGENYPDALLLEELLVRLLRCSRFDTRRQRAALRQGWLLRCEYAGHTVPATPTSPGERMRVYPMGRIPADRTRRLFDVPLSIPSEALRASIEDLQNGFEELGAAVFLDRPYGDGKQPVEPDATPIVASMAYSRAIALRRWRRLTGEDHSDLTLPGLPLTAITPARRPASLSLTDAARVSSDFVFRRTLPTSLRRLGLKGTLLARSSRGLTLYDDQYQPLQTWQIDYSPGYVWRDGLEYPILWASGVCQRPD